MNIADFVGYHSSIHTLLAPLVPTNLLQVFVTNPCTLSMPTLDNLAFYAKPPLDRYQFIFHGPYTTNLVRQRQDTFDFTVNYITQFFALASSLWKNPPILVIHTSKPDKGALPSSQDFAYKRIRLFAMAFRLQASLLIKDKKVNLAIEVDSNALIHQTSLQGLSNFIDEANIDGLSICFDTSHAFAAGFDLLTEDLGELNTPWHHISVVHLNAIQSGITLGCGKDRHSKTALRDSLGGTAWIYKIVKECKTRNIPMIFERSIPEVIIDDFAFVKSFWGSV